jgi:hypothetical protein
MRYLKITYMRRATGEMDEQVEIVKRLRSRDISEGSVILDFRDRCVIKASVGDQIAPRDWQRIRDFYHQHYADIIDQLEAVKHEKSHHTH